MSRAAQSSITDHDDNSVRLYVTAFFFQFMSINKGCEGEYKQKSET